MCSVCVKQHPSFCPECQIEIGLGGEFKDSKKEVVIMSSSGLIVGLLYLGFLYMENPQMQFINYNYWGVLLAFGVGISIVGTYFVLRYSSFFQDVRVISIFGFKVTILVLVLTLVSTIPIFYYLYHVISLLWQMITGRKGDV